MQTNDGKIVYLLPSKSISTHSSNFKLQSKNKLMQHLSNRESLPSALDAKSFSDRMSATVKVHDVSEILDEPIYSTKNLSSSDEHKIKEVEALEAKLSSYQNVVEKYEKLAEDATTAAIDERKSQLLILEEQLRKREQSAKHKLANAMNVMEDSHAMEDSISSLVTKELDSEHEIPININEVNSIEGKIELIHLC